jgi:16S rRNA (cytidine1402-2'-O)-methyltransferase
MSSSTGTLFIVSTPIGNLGDLSPRAAETLKSVKYVLCESTEQTNKLLNHLLQTSDVCRPANVGRLLSKSATKLIRYEGKGPKSDWQIQKVIADLQNNDSVALVSNAGTPLVSDPGAKLVAAVVVAGLPVVHIPGPAAFVSACVISGLPTKNILFIGFLPKKTVALTQKLIAARSALLALNEPASLATYVPKYQLDKTIVAVTEVFGENTLVSLARELTKLHEDHFTGPISQVSTWLSASPHRSKGEFTLVISPVPYET